MLEILLLLITTQLNKVSLTLLAKFLYSRQNNNQSVESNVKQLSGNWNSCAKLLKCLVPGFKKSN